METLNFYPRETGHKIKPCPFCGDEEPALWEAASIYWVQCKDCNATTSLEHDPEVALVKWNERVCENE